jgi:hypothetical protein
MAAVGALALALTGAPRPASAWDDFGHMQVAAAAYKKLTAATRRRVAALLALNPRHANWIIGAAKDDQNRVAFMRAATWADAIKSDPAYTDKDDTQSAPTASQNLGYADRLRHRYWHFVDQPFSADGTPTVPAAGPNVATQIAAFRDVLRAAGPSDDVKSYDLAWLLHLVGDVHQPLHCTSRFDAQDPAGDQGGNLVLITGNAPPPICDDPQYCKFDPAGNLHAFYDDVTGDSYTATEAEAAARALPAPDTAKAAIADENVWVQEGLTLAQAAVYAAPIGVGHGPFAADKAYQDAAYALGRQRIALAGARLAALLNDAVAAEARANRTALAAPTPPVPGGP